MKCESRPTVTLGNVIINCCDSTLFDFITYKKRTALHNYNAIKMSEIVLMFAVYSYINIVKLSESSHSSYL